MNSQTPISWNFARMLRSHSTFDHRLRPYTGRIHSQHSPHLERQLINSQVIVLDFSKLLMVVISWCPGSKSSVVDLSIGVSPEHRFVRLRTTSCAVDLNTQSMSGLKHSSRPPEPGHVWRLWSLRGSSVLGRPGAPRKLDPLLVNKAAAPLFQSLV